MNEKLRIKLEAYAKRRTIECTTSSLPDEWYDIPMDEVYDRFMESQETPEDFIFYDGVDYWNDVDKGTQDTLLSDRKYEIYDTIMRTYILIKKFEGDK